MYIALFMYLMRASRELASLVIWNTLYCVASVHDTHGQGAIKFWLYATIAAAIPLGLAWRNAQHHIEEEDHEERAPYKAFQFTQNRTRVRDLSPSRSFSFWCSGSSLRYNTRILYN